MTEVIVTSLALDAEDHAVQYGIIKRPDPKKATEIVPFTLWPASSSQFPKRQLDFIIKLQEDYNLLISNISQDGQLLMGSLQQ